MKDTIKEQSRNKGRIRAEGTHGLSTGMHGRAWKAGAWRAGGKWRKKGRESGSVFG